MMRLQVVHIVRYVLDCTTYGGENGAFCAGCALIPVGLQ